MVETPGLQDNMVCDVAHLELAEIIDLQAALWQLCSSCFADHRLH
jgi:hypothetical protein